MISRERPDPTGRELVVAAIEVEPQQLCNQCGGVIAVHEFNPLDVVRVLDIAQVEDGWLAYGRVATGHCVMCAQVYEALLRYIPIECASYRCPSCQTETLTCDVRDIHFDGDGYVFTAKLSCPSCGVQHAPHRVLRFLGRIRRLKVGPTGVEVEVSGSASTEPT
jgi:hypothetical protein